MQTSDLHTTVEVTEKFIKTYFFSWLIMIQSRTNLLISSKILLSNSCLFLAKGVT
jgi:hypothetical protein